MESRRILGVNGTMKFLLVGAAVLGLMSAAHAGVRTVGRPNIILLISDDQRPDTIHALGNELIRTPHLDALVHRGTAFTRATCGNPICTPSRAEILTGTSGFRNGVLDFGKTISTDVPRMAIAFREAGYRTFYTGKWHNNGRPADHGYERSVGLYSSGGGRFAEPQTDYAGRPVTGYTGWIFQTADHQLQPELGVGLTPDISGLFADAAIRVIEETSPQPFFLHVNFTAPHDPLLIPTGYRDRYDPRAMPLPTNFLAQHPFDHGNFDGRDEKLFEWPRTPKETRRELAAYYSVIEHLDAQIGRIVQALAARDQLDNTIVVFASDHGLAVGSHGLRGKQNMYEHTIGVPLIMAGPGIPGDRRSAAQCYLRDIAATVLDLAEIPIPAGMDSRSLKPVLHGSAEQIHKAVFGYFRQSQRMIRTEQWKLIRYPEIDRWQLFDLTHDPGELADLSPVPAHQDVLHSLQSQLLDWQRSVHDPVLTNGSPVP